MNRLEVSGDKRKSTPPDLLALSQMYFERNQVKALSNYSYFFVSIVLWKKSGEKIIKLYFLNEVYLNRIG